MNELVSTQFDHYLRERSFESFVQLREAVIASPAYNPYGDYRQTAHSLLEQDRYQEAAEYLLSQMPCWLLNPGIHKLASFVFHKLGKEDEAGFEYALAEMLSEAILSTGDGSEPRPYLVSCVADEYDVLKYLGKSLQRQSLVKKDDRRYDCLDCEDGSRIWFDVTAPLTHFEKTFGSMEKE